MAVGRVVAIGDSCIDEYVPPVGRAAVGGSALNVAVGLRRLGRDAAYLGAVGDDAPGERIRSVLTAEGVNAAAVAVVPGGPTAVTQIELRGDGDRTFLNEDFGVGADYSPSAGELDQLRDAAHVHLGITGLADHASVARAVADLGVPVSADFRDDYATADLGALAVAFYSAPAASAEGVASRALDAGAATVVVTCGVDGSYATDGAAESWAPAERLDGVVDTCGAGDAYIAAFIDRRLAGAPLAECMRAAAHAAARTCLHIGAFEQELSVLNGAGT